MSKTAEEYWKAFPKHKPAKDVDIAEAMREFAELYAQQRIAELEQSNKELVEAIEKILYEDDNDTCIYIAETALSKFKEVVPDNNTV